jgi:hypothetical protein
MDFEIEHDFSTIGMTANIVGEGKIIEEKGDYYNAPYSAYEYTYKVMIDFLDITEAIRVNGNSKLTNEIERAIEDELERLDKNQTDDQDFDW